MDNKVEWLDLIACKANLFCETVDLLRAPFCSGIKVGDRIRAFDDMGNPFTRIVVGVYFTHADSDAFKFAVNAMHNGVTDLLKVTSVIREEEIDYSEDEQNESV